VHGWALYPSLWIGEYLTDFSVETGVDNVYAMGVANEIQGPRMAEVARYHRYWRLHWIRSWQTARWHTVEGQEDHV